MLLCTLSMVACATWWDKNETAQETDSIDTEVSSECAVVPLLSGVPVILAPSFGGFSITT